MNLQNLNQQIQKRQLTKYSPGSVQELCTLTWPLVLSLLSTSFLNICNRLFLSHYSIEALESAVTAMNLAFLFQVPWVRLTSSAQISVAQLCGTERHSQIGSIIWQMIWLSLLSMLLTIPLGYGASFFFFQNTSIQAMGASYFAYLMFGNFLFPLGAALTAFFTGQGKTHIVTMITIFIHIIHIVLDATLIFGIPGLILPKGALGAAISTITVQSLYCLILLSLFLRKNIQVTYGTDKWRLQLKLLKICSTLGIPRALSKLIILLAWTFSIAILVHQNGDYLLTFSLGVSLHAFFSCLNEGLGQGLTTLFSYHWARKNKVDVLKTVQSGLIVLGIAVSILSIFLLIFPRLTISAFFSHALTPLQLSTLVYASYGLWFFFLCEGLSWIGFSLLSAFEDTKFIMLYTLITVCIFNYIPIHLAFRIAKWPADRIWWLMAIPCFASAIAYYFRISRNMNHYSSPKKLGVENESKA